VSRIALTDCSFSYRRWFREVPVFDGISVEFQRGTTIILGPNGAGKSTLMSMATGNLRPNAGQLSFDGVPVDGARSLNALRRRVAWLPQQIEAVPGLRVREQVAYAGWLKGMNRGRAWSAAATALAKVDLADLAERPSGKLSGGQRRRMGIAQSLVHDAEFIFMDEPTAGLDPLQYERFNAVVAELSEDTNFVISTHDVNDLDARFDHVVVLSGGRKAYAGDVAGFLDHAEPSNEARSRPGSAYRSLVEGRRQCD
jgi:ABC-2 type transport system ATP-binding protein